MKKICTKCKVEKNTTEFNKKNRNKDGLSSQCRECNKLNLKAHYNNNKKYYKERNINKRNELKEWFLEYKKTLKCSVCSESRYWVLDFHHRDPNKKEGAISYLLGRYGKNKALKEIEKCDVVCANCHRDIHHKMEN